MIRQIQSMVTGPLLPVLATWVVILTILWMPLYPFLTTWIGAELGAPLVWKAAKDILLAIVATVLGLWLLFSQERRQLMARDWLLWTLLAVLLVSVLVSVLQYESFNDQLLAGIASNGRYLAILFIGYSVIRYGGVRLSGLRLALPFLGWVGVVLAVLGIIQVFFLPATTLEMFGYDKATTIAPFTMIDDNPDALRAFATLRGPNDYAAFLLLTTIAAAVLSMKHRMWALGVFVMVFAMVLSSSRSAWLGLVVSFGILAAIVYIKSSKRIRQVMIAAAVTLTIIGISLLALATTVPALRLAIFHSSPDDTHLTEGSTDDHWKASAAGVERAIEQPLGCGVGCSGPASFYSESPKIAENYFIQIVEEIGWLGLVAWLSMFAIAMRRLWLGRQNQLALMLFASGIGLSVIGVWLHVWADDPVAITWWGLAGLALGHLATRSPGEKRVH